MPGNLAQAVAMPNLMGGSAYKGSDRYIRAARIEWNRLIFNWIRLNCKPRLHIPYYISLPYCPASTSHCAAVPLLGNVPLGGRFMRVRISALAQGRGRNAQ